MKTFTIFTGTYFSENVIERVLNSVRNQSVQDFEWIIIDDCSKDNTIKILQAFKAANPDLDIQIYQHSANTGVAVSRREALKYAKGKYFITWDHDDEQSHNQLETFLSLWEKNDDEKIANIFAKIRDQHGKLLGKLFPNDSYISDYISVHNDYLVGNKDSGNIVEHHVCVKTEKFREVVAYYDEHKHLLNGLYPNGGDVWGMLAYLGYKTIYSNTPVRTYYVNEPGRQTMSSVKRHKGAERVFRNKLLWVNLFDTRLPINETPKKFRNIFAVMLYGSLAKKSFFDIQGEISSVANRLFALVLYLPAFLLAKKFERE